MRPTGCVIRHELETTFRNLSNEWRQIRIALHVVCESGVLLGGTLKDVPKK
jgi:hypothetical protein